MEPKKIFLSYRGSEKNNQTHQMEDFLYLREFMLGSLLVMKCTGIATPVTNKILLQFGKMNVERSREQSSCHARKQTADKGRIYLKSLRESASSGMSVMSSWGRDKQLSIIASLFLTSLCLNMQSARTHLAKNRCFTVTRA